MATGLAFDADLGISSLQHVKRCVEEKASPVLTSHMATSPSSFSSSPPPRRRSSDHTPSLAGFDGLLAAAKRGEDAAWNVLIGSVAGQLLGYARSKGAVDPEDLVGDLFLRIAKKITDFEGDEADFRAWTFTIMHRLIIDDHRKRSSRPMLADSEIAIDLAIGHDNTEATVLARFATDEASALIDELPSDQADVMRLSILGQLTTVQIADVLGKRPGGVRALRFRALKRLNRRLEEVTQS